MACITNKILVSYDAEQKQYKLSSIPYPQNQQCSCLWSAPFLTLFRPEFHLAIRLYQMASAFHHHPHSALVVAAIREPAALRLVEVGHRSKALVEAEEQHSLASVAAVEEELGAVRRN